MLYTRRLMFAGLIAFSNFALAHGGGLNAQGCHNNRKTGDYHCHRAPAVAATAQPSPAPAPNAAPTPRPPVAAAGKTTLPPGCFMGPRGGTYTITKSGRKNYGGC